MSQPNSGQPTDFQVKGSSICSKLHFAQECTSPEVTEHLHEWLGEATGGHPILEANWYPFDLYDGLLRALAREAFDNDLQHLEAVGIFSAEQALTTVYDVYTIQRDFLLFLRKISSLHDRFYSRSQLSLERSGDGFCELHLRDVPVDFSADIHVAAGFYIGAARLMKLENVRCERRIESDLVLFKIFWNS